MESLLKRALIPSFQPSPIPHFAVSASGLVALADLSTIAQRTALTGGSSWLDSLLLAPGLHYEQAADEIASKERAGILGFVTLTAVETDSTTGKVTTYTITNQAIVNYIQRVARAGEVVTLDVGQLPPVRTYWRSKNGDVELKRRRSKRTSARSQRDIVYSERNPDLGWYSHLLYLISPVLTVLALVFIIIIEDWWALVFISALMLSRIINIWIIKQRSYKPKPSSKSSNPPVATPLLNQENLPRTPPRPQQRQQQQEQTRQSTSPQQQNQPPPNQLTSYLVHIRGNAAVVLHGMSDDLQAITTTVWLRPKTVIEGYLEAIAKLLVYLVAALSGNSTQAGSLIMLVLLIVTAGLLALSNGNAKSLTNNGRIVAPNTDAGTGTLSGQFGHEGRRGIPGSPPYPMVRHHNTASWPGSSNASGMTGMEDWAEKGQIGGRVRDARPFEDKIEYS